MNAKDTKLKNLLKHKNDTEKKINKFILTKVSYLLDQLGKGRISESDLLDELSEYTSGSRDAQILLDLTLKQGKKRKIDLPLVKNLVANNLLDTVKAQIFGLPEKDIIFIRSIFESIGDKNMVEMCDKLFDYYYWALDELTLLAGE